MDAPRLVIAKTDKEFDRLFNETGCTVELEMGKAEYEAKDSMLIKLIRHACSENLTPEESKLIHQNEDWWPNQTRYVDCAVQVFSSRVVDRLRELVRGPYDGWRIQLVVYGDPMKGTTMIGSVVIHAEWLLIDRHLLPYLR
jgi:hypothetical protein